jgi:predicted nucleic acid-binding protein
VPEATSPLIARRNIYNSPALEILFSSKEDEIAAIGIFRKYSGQKVSFTDCISFVLMRRQGITRVFSFDRHFEHAGFRTIGVETES